MKVLTIFSGIAVISGFTSMARAEIQCDKVFASASTKYRQSSNYSAVIGPELINNGVLLQYVEKPMQLPGPRITGYSVATSAGATPLELLVKLKNGQTFNLLGARTPFEIEKAYRASQANGDNNASNQFFQPGAMAPLSPNPNRLTGEIKDGVLTAKVKGIEVRMPVNHGLGKGQIPHHLHGLAFDKEPTIETSNSADGAQIKAHFAPGFNGDYWTGRLSLDITHTLSNGIYEFKMRTTNRGSGLVPVGAGAHPYFLAPSGDPSAVRLYVPAKSLVEIDNYKNVLPTGRIVKIKKRSKFDFNDPKGRPIAGQYYDNLWVDLDLNEQGYAFADFIDEKEGIRTRMTATTKNIIGIQVYAPKPGTNPALGVFAAIEFVTSLPDARDELWKDNDTGMVVLKPGESMDYGYTIEVFPI